MMATGKRITVVESDGSDSEAAASSDDDMPPPLEDMSDSIRFKKKYTERKPAATKRSTRAPQTNDGAGAAAPPVDRGQFTPHTNVTLHGLSAAKYNGLTGVVKGYDSVSGRHEVKLDSGKTLKVKPVNLKKAETFSGLGKGFFARKTAENDDDDIEVITPKKPGSKAGELSEVQEAMAKAAPFLEQRKDEWCTPDLLEKFEKIPGMAAMMENPMFARALTEFQENPGVAMQKYGDNPQVAKFFQSFMGVMGNHLSELGEKEEAAKAGSAKGQAGPIQQQPAADPEAMAALAKPGVREALQDPRIGAMIEALRRNPERSREITAAARRDPDVAVKLRTLCEAGVLAMQ